jgi:transcriptional regulator GlxA family with amidase domain
VVEHIDANISGRLTVAELAVVAQMSASHFSRTFRETVGMPPHCYVMSRRVATAQRLIASGEHALAEIALLCGAADQAHLNRLFTKHCGVSPGAWRREASW